MDTLTLLVLALVCADALVLLGVLLARVRALRALTRHEGTAQERYWRTQHGQTPPPLP